MRRHALKFLEKLKFAEDEIPPKNPFPVPVRRPSSDFLEIKIVFEINFEMRTVKTTTQECQKIQIQITFTYKMKGWG